MTVWESQAEKASWWRQGLGFGLVMQRKQGKGNRMRKQENNVVNLSLDKQTIVLNSVLDPISAGSKKEFQDLKIPTPLNHRGNTFLLKTEAMWTKTHELDLVMRKHY